MQFIPSTWERWGESLEGGGPDLERPQWTDAPGCVQCG
ncbi:hypothetical protein HNR07_004105 [Nocardiopsis metallicus]|uniref:Uncharacterized protein n=1 Tax=Nocardiopsis metallicus TaxID=179819 RepID=A0A840WS58_9ACTN|nr:hypothetical protein [Nocardiopsis metallicus]